MLSCRCSYNCSGCWLGVGAAFEAGDRWSWHLQKFPTQLVELCPRTEKKEDAHKNMKRAAALGHKREMKIRGVQIYIYPLSSTTSRAGPAETGAGLSLLYYFIFHFSVFWFWFWFLSLATFQLCRLSASLSTAIGLLRQSALPTFLSAFACVFLLFLIHLLRVLELFAMKCAESWRCVVNSG